MTPRSAARNASHRSGNTQNVKTWIVAWSFQRETPALSFSVERPIPCRKNTAKMPTLPATSACSGPPLRPRSAASVASATAEIIPRRNQSREMRLRWRRIIGSLSSLALARPRPPPGCILPAWLANGGGPIDVAYRTEARRAPDHRPRDPAAARVREGGVAARRLLHAPAPPRLGAALLRHRGRALRPHGGGQLLRAAAAGGLGPRLRRARGGHVRARR